jgi:hypothetical protein
MAEDAPKAATEGIQPVTPEGFAAAAPATAASVNVAEARLPLLSIWPPLQRMRDVVVRRLVQTLVTPNVLSQRYEAVPKPDAEHATATVEAESFVASTKSLAAKSPTSVEEGLPQFPIR